MNVRWITRYNQAKILKCILERKGNFRLILKFATQNKQLFYLNINVFFL